MGLSATRLDLGYAGRRVVAGLDLAIADGQFCGLIGPNGSGKSTLLHGLGRLLVPQGGVLTLDGRAIADWPRRGFAREVAILTQSPAVPEGITVRDLVGYGRHPHRPFLGPGDPDGSAAIADALEATDLGRFAERRLTDLSGGERQRAWIALALAQRARTLLLDEPTTFLDMGHQLDLLELLRRLNRERGLTVVASLHDLGQAARYADRLVAVSGGRIAADGPPAEVLTEALLAEIFGVEATILWHEGVPLCLPLRTCEGNRTSFHTAGDTT